MRLLALMTDAFGGAGGIARFNRDLLNALSVLPQIERVDVACRHRPRHEVELPPRIFQNAVPLGRIGYAANAIAEAFAGHRYDAVFCGHLHLAPIAVTFARLCRIPLWTQIHGIEAWQRPGAVRSSAIERSSLITAVSRFTRARFLEWANVEDHRVRVLPGTTDERFHPGPKPLALARRLGLEGCRVLLTVSRLDAADRYKGHERVIGALAQLVAEMPDIVYLVVGDGDDRPRLEALARELGVGDRVRFTGAVGDGELVDYYRLADVFVMPSTKEGFGIVFLEAAAAGLPVIGGSLDGSADPLADGRFGTLIDPERPEELLEAIRANLDARSVATAELPFSPANFQRHVQRLLGSLAGDAAQGVPHA